MSELLKIYQDNLSIIFNKIMKIMQNLNNLPTDKFDLACKDLDINFKEGERMLKQIDLEVSTSTSIDSKKAKGIYTGFKRKFDDHKSRYFKLKESYTYTKKMEEMIITTQREASENSMLQLKAENNLESNATVSNMSDKLEVAKHSALSVENMSKNVMFDLENQSQQLKSTSAKVVGLNNSIESSNSIITRIMNRENRSKAMIGVFSVTLITVFLFILSSRF